MQKTTLMFMGLACLALNVRAAKSGEDHRPAIEQKVSATAVFKSFGEMS